MRACASRGGSQLPKQRGQSGQASPEPVARTSPPIATRARVAPAVAAASLRRRVMEAPPLYRRRSLPVRTVSWARCVDEARELGDHDGDGRFLDGRGVRPLRRVSHHGGTRRPDRGSGRVVPGRRARPGGRSLRSPANLPESVTRVPARAGGDDERSSTVRRGPPSGGQTAGGDGPGTRGQRHSGGGGDPAGKVGSGDP